MKNKKCTNCPSHQTIPDPDPYDWFCDDDVAIVCMQMPNESRNMASLHFADRNPYKIVSCGVRPHYAEKEAKIPKWCPRRKLLKNVPKAFKRVVRKTKS